MTRDRKLVEVSIILSDKDSICRCQMTFYKVLAEITGTMSFPFQETMDGS